MAYLGNQPVVGDSANTFKLLDDISTFTLTFDGSSTDVVSVANDTLTFANHRFITGQKVTYTDGGGTVITGLTDGTSYFIIKVDQNTIKLATNASNAASSTAIDLTGVGAGTSHTLNVAFDGVNTKFKATHTNGIKASISRAAQLSLSINGVIQQPTEAKPPTVGYGIEPDSTIVFSTAPVATDKVFGTFIGEVAPSFDLTDNTVDNFTGDGSTTTFTLSRETPSSRDVLITLDGVTQHPSDASTTRSYSVVNQGLSFTSAPADGVAIQARHIGFAGATTSAVTGFYGRTGNVALTSTDDISVSNISAGIITATTFGGNPSFTGNVSIGGTLTYEDVTNIDAVGLITARQGIKIGTGVGVAASISVDGNAEFSGIATVNNQLHIPDYIHHVGDNDCKFGFESGDTFAVETAGSERFRVTSAGLVGIATGTPTRQFEIYHSSHATAALKSDTQSSLFFSDPADTNVGQISYMHSGSPNDYMYFRVNDDERLRIDSSGRVLIGHQSSQQSTSMLQVSRANNSIIRVASSDATATNFAAVDLAPANNIAGARIAAVAQGTFGSSGAETAYLKFDTRNAGTTAERVRIHSNGIVSIGDDHSGAASLGADLNVVNVAGANMIVGDTVSGEYLELKGTGGAASLGSRSNHPLRFFTNGTSNERLRIDTSGQLLMPAGIGPQLTFENQHSVTTDAAISTYDDAAGTLLCLGSNFYFNSSGSETRYNTGEESSAIVLNRNGDLNLKTGGTGATATTRLSINSSGQVGINRTPALAYSKLEVGGADNYPLINVEASGATGGMGIGSGILRLYYGTVSRLNITDSTALVSASNFGASGYVRSAGPGGGSGIKLQGLAAGSGSNAVDTGISVNRGNAGGTMIVIGCRNTGAGTATQSHAWLLKFQYDGNNLPTEYSITGTGSFWSLSKSGSNTLQINGNAGNWQFGGIWVD